MGLEQSTEVAAPSSDNSQTSEVDGGLPSVLVVCGPSGVGKGTLIDILMKESDGFGFSVSHTTRPTREHEKDGVHYHFISKPAFEKGISDGMFLEYAQVHENFYGTSKDAVNAVLNSGKCCVLDIDVQGARQVKESGIRAVFIFVAPPSVEELETRLRGRGTDSEEQIQIRLRNAKQEMESLREPGLFDFCVVNGDLSEAYAQLKAIAMKARVGKKPEAQEVKAISQSGSPTAPGSVDDPTEDPTSNHIENQSPAASLQLLQGMGKWKGKVALVTGASAGIGWATCEALALAGMRVVAVARRRERLEKLQQTVIAKGVAVQDFLPVVCDTTKEGEVVALPRIVAKRWPESPCIDVLVNNAGLARDNAGLMDGNTTSWVEMLSTNVLGVCMCSREVIKTMKQHGRWGHIVNVSSLSGHRVPPPQSGGGGFYAATKHAVRALSEGLRSEARAMGVPLRVSCISPGVVQTEFLSVKFFGDDARANETYSTFKCLTAADIANSILWTIAAPDRMEVNDILLRPTEQVF